MKRSITTIAMTLVAALILSTGCVSHQVAKGSKSQVALRKAISANNANAIQALKNGASPSTAGIEVGIMETVTERPALQAGAAIADALIVWGGYEGVQWLSDQSGDGNSSANTSKTIEGGRDSTNVEIIGDGNTVQVRGDVNTTGGSSTPAPVVTP